MSAKETTLNELGEMLGHVVEHMATKEDLGAFRTELRDDIARLDARVVRLDQRVAAIEHELSGIRRDLVRARCEGGKHYRLPEGN